MGFFGWSCPPRPFRQSHHKHCSASIAFIVLAINMAEGIERQGNVLPRRRSSSPLEMRASVESVDVGSGMAAIPASPFKEYEYVGSVP